MSRRPWLGLALSLLLHAGVIALVLVVVSRDELPALMVDLRDHFVSGAAAVRSPARERRPAPAAYAPRSHGSRSKRDEVATAPSPTLPPPSAPTAPAPASPPATVADALPVLPPLAAARASEPPRRGPPLASPSAREGVEPRSSGSPGGATTSETSAPAGGGSSVVSRGDAGGERGIAAGSAAGFDHGTGGRREESGSAGSLVASVPPGGGGGGVGAEFGPYLAALRQRIQQSVRYPASARRRGIAGTVSVEILIRPNGTIGDVTVLESSSHSVLDEAALDTIRSLPRMPLPPDLPARPLRVRVPVVFQLR